MRNLFYQLLPIVFGLFLGWMLFNPPVWMADLGPARWLVNGALAALLLLTAVPLIVLANLPEQLKMSEAAPSEVCPELRAMAAEFAELGFRPVGPALRVEVAPAAIVLGFVHESEPVYATAFRTTTVPNKTSRDFISILHGDGGALTTNPHPEGAALPASAGTFRQVLPGASAREMFEAHLEGMRFLGQRGLAFRSLSADGFRDDLRLGIRKQRETFLASPLRGAWLTFVRASTKRVPFVGRLSQQPVVTRQLAQLRAGGSGGAF